MGSNVEMRSPGLPDFGRISAQSGVFQSAPSKSPLAERALSGLKMAGAVVANQLPFSGRSVVGIAVKAPLRFVQALATAAKSQSGETVASKFTELMKNDWKGGIQDIPKDVGKLPESEQSAVKKQMDQYNSVKESGQDMIKGYSSPSGSGLVGLSPKLKLSDEHKELFGKLSEPLTNLGFKPEGHGFYHEQSGTRVALLFNNDTKELSLFFMGLGVNNTQDKGFNTRLGQIATESIGGVSLAARQSIDLGKALGALQKENPGITLSVVGHSHGEGLAQTVALAAGNGVKAFCFNSRPISGATRLTIGEEHVTGNAKNVTHFCKQGDWLTGTRAINALAAGWERATGFRKTRNIGTVYSVEASTSQKELPLLKRTLAIHNETSWENRTMSPEQLTEALHTPPPPQNMSAKAKKMMLNLE